MLIPVKPKQTPPFLFLCRNEGSTYFIPISKITMVRDNYLFVDGIPEGIYLSERQMNYFYELSFDPGEVEDYMEMTEQKEVCGA